MNLLTCSAAAAALLFSTISVRAQDASAWAGFNIGVQLTTADGGQSYGEDGPAYDILGEGQGIFAGYMVARGPWAFGAELAYASTDYFEHEIDGPTTYPDFTFSKTVDLKGRVGYAVDRALVYGVLGYGTADWEEGGPESTFTAEGAIFGLGVDYRVSERVFLGAEVLRRDLNNDTLDGDGFTADLTTVSLRLGMTF